MNFALDRRGTGQYNLIKLIMYRRTATQSTVRRLNERAVVRFLQTASNTTRARCAKGLGISQPTAGKIVDDLVARKVVEEVAPAEANPMDGPRRMGRPGEMLRLDQSQPRYVLIHLGVRETRMVVAPVGLRPDVSGEGAWAESFPTGSSPTSWGENLLAAASRLPRRGLWGTVVSVPGVVDEAAARVVFSPNLHWTESTDICAICRGVWRLPTLLVQEIRALALGHRMAEPAADDFLLVDFGTGVGAAAVIRGQLYSGALPLSGELGHTPVPGNSRRCGCGAIGCLETVVSRNGLLQSVNESLGPQLAVENWQTLTSQVRAHGLSNSAGAGLRGALDAAAGAIAGALNVLGLQRAVITGSLTEMPAAIEYLSQAVVRGAMWGRFGQVFCSAAPRRRAAGLMAAAIDRQLLDDGQPPSSMKIVSSVRSSNSPLTRSSHG